jgi:methyl-accepting chemotaxis protein
MRLKDLKIGTRLAVGFGAMLVLMALIAGTGMHRLSNAGTATEQMIAGPLAKERLVAEWAKNLAASTVRARNYANVTTFDPATEAYYKKEIAAGQAIINPLQKKIEEIMVTPEEKKLYGDVAESRRNVLEMMGGLNKLKADRDQAGAKEMLDGPFAAGLATYEKAVSALADYEKSQIDGIAAGIEADQWMATKC